MLVDRLGEILATMRSDNEDLVLESVVRVRKMLSQEVNLPIEEVYGFPGMLDCLMGPAATFECTKCRGLEYSLTHMPHP